MKKYRELQRHSQFIIKEFFYHVPEYDGHHWFCIPVRPGGRTGNERGAGSPAPQPGADRQREPGFSGSWVLPSPTSTQRVCPTSATTAAANMLTWLRKSPSSVPASCSAQSMPMYSPTPAHRQTPPYTSHCSSRAIP